ncbi:MAG TPA: NYN domain-containing protein [Chloroflexi bacterium]|nr:NYN domain-containing protein [Chloroflexota bacterium]
MNTEDTQLPPVADVAMFIDWENMHGSIRGKANISALREVAEGYGRLVVAKAYADWREPRFQRDSLVLYKIGFEPVYVPAGFKNNADVKLATDCIDYAYKHPNIRVFILVTGDGDFIHVVTTLRPLGKKVVVIAQSGNASNRLGDLVDTLLIYEQDVNPDTSNAAPTPARKKRSKTPRTLDGTYKDIVGFLRKNEGSPILLTNVKQRLIRAHGKFDQRDYGFEKFKSMIQAGAKEGHFVLNNAGLRDWLTLPQQDTKAAETKLPDEVDEVFKEIVRIVKAVNHPNVFLSSVKHSLAKKYGGFDESVYGYSQFKEMMEEGESQNYFKLGVNDKQAYYAYLPKK